MMNNNIKEIDDKKAYCSIVAETLKHLRKIKGFKQANIADLTGITRNTYNNYEREVNLPDIYRFFQICFALEAEPKDAFEIIADKVKNFETRKLSSQSFCRPCKMFVRIKTK